MRLRNIAIIVFFILCLAPFHQTKAAATALGAEAKTDFPSSKQLMDTVKANTPEFISKHLIEMANWAENIRLTIADKSEEKYPEIRPLFENRYLFYGLAALILFMLVNFALRRLF